MSLTFHLDRSDGPSGRRGRFEAESGHDEDDIFGTQIGSKSGVDNGGMLMGELLTAPRRPNRRMSCVRKRPAPRAPRGSNFTLVRELHEDATLAKIKYLLQQLPIVKKRVNVHGWEKQILETTFERLLWRVYTCRKSHDDTYFRQTVDEYCEKAEKTIGKFSQNLEFARDGGCKLSLALACDCLARLSKKSPLLHLLYQQMVPAIFQDGDPSAPLKMYGCPLWSSLAASGDAIRPDRPDVLETLFNRADVGCKGLFLTKLFSACRSKERAITPSSESDPTGEEKGEDDQAEGLPLDFTLEDDSMQLALQALHRAPVDLLEVIFESFDLDEMNENLEYFCVLPRDQVVREQYLQLATRGKRHSLADPCSDSDSSCTSDDDDEEKDKEGFGDCGHAGDDDQKAAISKQDRRKMSQRITDFLSNSRLIQSAEENEKLRRRLLKNLVFAETAEPELIKILLLVLDHVTQSECSDEFYDQVLQSDSYALRTFARKLEKLQETERKTTEMILDRRMSTRPGRERRGSLFLNSSGSQVNGMVMRGSSSSRKSFMGGLPGVASGKLTGSFRSSSALMQSAAAALAALQGARNRLSAQDLPPTWNEFLPTFGQEELGAPQESDAEQSLQQELLVPSEPALGEKQDDPTFKLELLILDMYQAKIRADSERKAREEPRETFTFRNELEMVPWVVDYVIEQHGNKPKAQGALQQILKDVQEAEENNSWVNLFRTLCAIDRPDSPACYLLYQPVMHACLAALRLLTANLPFVDITGRSDPNLPCLEIGICIHAISTLRCDLPYLDLDQATNVFEQACERDTETSSDSMPLSAYMEFVYRAAADQMAALQTSLQHVYQDFCKQEKGAAENCDLVNFRELLRAGFDRLHWPKKRDFDDVAKKVFFALMKSEHGLDQVRFVQSIVLCTKTTPEEQLYTSLLSKPTQLSRLRRGEEGGRSSNSDRRPDHASDDESDSDSDSESSGSYFD